MNLLAIECSHTALSVAVQCGTEALLQTNDEPQRAAETIVPLIETVLTRASLAPRDLDAVAVSEGPGSFTSLRIGMSTAKGLCYALEKPLIVIPTFSAMLSAALSDAALQPTGVDLLVPLIHSKADEFFYAVVPRNEVESIDIHAATGYTPLEKILADLAGRAVPTAFVGTGLQRRFPAAAELPPYMKLYEVSGFSAVSLLALAAKRLHTKTFADLAAVQPKYLKDFEAKKSEKKFFG